MHTKDWAMIVRHAQQYSAEAHATPGAGVVEPGAAYSLHCANQCDEMIYLPHRKSIHTKADEYIGTLVSTKEVLINLHANIRTAGRNENYFSISRNCLLMYRNCRSIHGNCRPMYRT